MAYVTGDPDVVLERLWREMKAIYEQYSVPHRYVTFGTTRVFFKYEDLWQVEGQCSSVQVDGASYGGSLESSYEYSARHPPEIVNLLGIFMGNGNNLGC